MAIYDWPTGRTFMPQQSELRVVDNTQRSLESPLSGYVQTLSMPGARWGWGFDFGAHDLAERAALEAMLLRLSGRQHRVRLWDMKQPRPRGSIQTGGVTLAAAAAQFATTLQLAGCVGANRLLGGSFEFDSNADGLADGWSRYSAGTAGALTHSRSTSIVWDAAYSQNLVAASLGATSADRQGIARDISTIAGLAGSAVTFSCRLLGTAGARANIELYWRDGGGTILGSIIGGPLLLNGDYQAIVASGTCPVGAVSASLYLYQHSAPAGAVGLFLDLVRVEQGSVVGSGGAATLLAGDWLGLAAGQLVRVVSDAVANDAGVMTVEVRHMLRAAAASGSAVTLDKPTALFVRTESGLAMPRMAGQAAPEMSTEFVEVFA